MGNERRRFDGDTLTTDVDNRVVTTEHGRFAGHPWYDVTAFGADGDGNADDARAIQRAVDVAADDGGGTVYLPPGEFRVLEPVTLRSGVRIAGEHTGATAIVADGAGFSALEGFGSAGDPLTDVTVTDLSIDCSTLGDGTYSTGEKCIYIQYVRRCQILRVYAYGAPATGIGTDFMLDSVIHGCVAERNGRGWSSGEIGSNGIGIGAGRYEVETVTVSNCHTLDNGNNGIMFEAQGPASDDVHAGLMRAIGCTARDNRIGFRDAADRRVAFLGCAAAGNDEHGIVVSEKADTSFAATEHRIGDCQVVDNGTHGIAVIGAAIDAALGVTDCVITGNEGRGVSVSTGDPIGGISITDSDVFANGASGVHYRGGGEHVVIARCRISDNGLLTDGDRPGVAAGISLEAPDRGAYRHVRIDDNDCYDTGDPVTQRFGLVVDGTNERTRVTGNAFDGNRDGALYYTDRPTVVSDNLGYPTEAGGCATVADGQPIEHGLAERPTVVTLETGSTARAVPERIDDATITVGLHDLDGRSVETAENVYWTAAAR